MNDFYRAHIFKTYSVAKHIFEMRIDERLRIGDLTLVEDLAKTEMPDKSIRNFYSFATKYCSHHRPEAYAIYDSYIGSVLRYLRNKDKFASFKNNDLKDYRAFIGIIRTFQEFYGLEEYSLKKTSTGICGSWKKTTSPRNTTSSHHELYLQHRKPANLANPNELRTLAATFFSNEHPLVS